MSMAMGKNLFNPQKNYALFRDGSVIGECTETEYNKLKQGYQVSDLLFRKLYK